MRFYNKDGIIYSDEMKVVDGKQKRIRKSLKIPFTKINIRKLEQAYKQEQEKDNVIKNFKTFGQLFEDYIESKETEGAVRKYTISGYKRLIEKNIYQYFKNKYIHEITIEDIDTIKLNMLRTMSTRSVKNTFVPLKAIFKIALKYKYIKENPMNFLDTIKQKTEEKTDKLRPFSKDEINFLINNSKGNLKSFIALSYYLGTRPSELIALKWCDVHLEEKYAEITGAITGNQTEKEKELTKSISSKRKIFFPSSALDYFNIQKNDAEYVFINLKKEPYCSADKISRDFTKLVRQLSCGSHTLYDIRHSYASINISENIMPIALISKQMGHKDSYVTLQTYAKYIKNSDYETKSIIEEAFNK